MTFRLASTPPGQVESELAEDIESLSVNSDSILLASQHPGA